jgi:uridine phosphorylase
VYGHDAVGDPIHLHPTAALAERVLLPGDPGRALLLAQELLDQPVMFNHHRGLWGYTGVAADGGPLTIQSTGMGGPSAAIVIAELIDLGARWLIRTGTCGAIDSALTLGQLLVVTEAIAADGTSRALGADGTVAPDPVLTAALAEQDDPDASAAGDPNPSAAGDPNARAAGDPDASAADARGPATGPVASTDLFYDARDQEEAWRAAGVRAVEMESATLFALARRRGVAAASVLIVTDLLAMGGDRARIDAAALPEAERRLGRLAAGALKPYSDAEAPAA